MSNEPRSRVWLLFAALAGVWSFGLLLAACENDSASESLWTPPDPATAVLRMGEDEHRKHLINGSLPTYPASSLRSGREGVAVASIVAGRDGQVETIELLQAPDEAIGRAVEEALEQWTFTPGRAPLGDGGSLVDVRIESRLTFYFRIVDGTGVVLSPAEAMQSNAVDNDVSGAPRTTRRVADLRGAHLQTVFGAREPAFVDIREREEYRRGHRPGSVNIPVSELETRASRELAPDRFVVILCSGIAADAWRFCTAMAQRVAGCGFRVRARRGVAEWRNSSAMKSRPSPLIWRASTAGRRGRSRACRRGSARAGRPGEYSAGTRPATGWSWD